MNFRNCFSRSPSWLKVSLFLCCFTILLVASGLAGNLQPFLPQSLVFGALGCLSGILTLWIFRKLNNNASTGLVAGNRILPQFALGILIGFIAFALVFFPLIWFTPLTINYAFQGFSPTVLITIVSIFLLALMEELGFRSYPQQVLAKKYGIWVSQIAMAIVFATYHVFYGWSAAAAFTGPFVWAFLFGLSALWSRGIAAPTAIHFTLNLLQQAFGLKAGALTAWTVSFPPGSSKTTMAAAEKLGTVLHWSLLACLLAVTFLFHKKVQKRHILWAFFIVRLLN